VLLAGLGKQPRASQSRPATSSGLLQIFPRWAGIRSTTATKVSLEESLFFQANWFYGSGRADEIAARQRVSYPFGWQGAPGPSPRRRNKSCPRCGGTGGRQAWQGSGGLPVPVGKGGLFPGGGGLGAVHPQKAIHPCPGGAPRVTGRVGARGVGWMRPHARQGDGARLCLMEPGQQTLSPAPLAQPWPPRSSRVTAVRELGRWGCVPGVRLDSGSPLAPDQISSPKE